MPRLLVERPDQPSITVDIHHGLTVGRNEAADVIVLDSRVSRHHLKFCLEPERKCLLLDLNSTHGTLVNGKPIKSCYLADGDQIQIGEVRLTYIDPEEATEVSLVKATDPDMPIAANDADAGRRLRVFFDISKAVSQIENTDALLGRMLEAIVDVLGCERGVVALCEPGAAPDNLRRITRTRLAKGAGEIVISRSILEATLSRRQGVIACGPSRMKTMLDHKILSAIAVPLMSGSRVFGLVYVDDRGSPNRFSTEDLDFLGALAHLAAAAFENAERYQRMTRVAEALSKENELGELIGESEAMRELKAAIQKFAPAPAAHVLIHGESGTGKELVARRLHALSPRANRPLVTINCAAIPEAMVESELFGHVKGAFTGAVSDKRGKFVIADKGTLFLDEIGDLSLTAQAKVLRAIQQGEVSPVGSEKTLHVDVRVFSATHKNLAAEVEAGRFRRDLFYRLNVLELYVPPLRERVEDIPLLARAFLAAAAAKIGKRVVDFTPEAMAALARYPFPGNVRELQNEVERAVIVIPGSDDPRDEALVDIVDLSERVTGAPSAASRQDERPLDEQHAALEPMERAVVWRALERAKWNVAEAARLLGVTRVVLKGKMKRLGLDGTEPD